MKHPSWAASNAQRVPNSHCDAAALAKATVVVVAAMHELGANQAGGIVDYVAKRKDAEDHGAYFTV